MELLNAKVYVAFTTGFLVGCFLGYLAAKRTKTPDTEITAIQMLALVGFIVYVVVTLNFNREPSWIIALGILTTGYGAKGGEVLERFLEKRK